MAGGVVDFRWEVSPDGYSLVEGRQPGKSAPERFLADRAGVQWNLRQYKPLEDPTLFRIFADTETSEDGIATFANRYGLLGLLCPIQVGANREGVAGEALSDWSQAIMHMRRTIEVWDALQARDAGTLAKRIRISADGASATYYLEGENGPEVSELIYGDQYRDALGEHIKPGDLARPALFWVQKTINRYLEQFVSPRLLFVPEKGSLELLMRPKHLLGALWLQFAGAVDAGKEFRRCRSCGNWFEVSFEGARQSKEFCDQACRSRHYRGKKAEATRLASDGVAIEEIARQVESDPETVQGWLSRK